MLFKQYRPILERSATLIASPGTRRHLSTPSGTIVALSSPAYRSSARAALRVQSRCNHRAAAILQLSYHRTYTTNSTPQPSGLRIPYYTAEELEAMTVPDLRTLLKDNGLKVSGRKANLVDRVLKYVHQHHGAEKAALGASRTPAQIAPRSGSGSDSVSASAQSETDKVAIAKKVAAEQQLQRLKELQEQERQLLAQQAKELKLKEQREREALQLEQQEKERLIKEQQRRDMQLKEQQEKERRLVEQRDREARLREQHEKEARLREQQEKEARLREQQEKEARLREQQEKEARLREQQEKEIRLKEQQVKEQQVKDRLEKEQRLMEQQEKEQRLKEQQEQERNVKQKLDNERVLKEQQEKERQIIAQKNHEPLRKQQLEQQERSQSNTNSQKANTNESTGNKDEWAKEKIPLRTKAASAVLGLGIVAWFLAGKRNRRGTLDSEAQEPHARLKEKDGH